MTLVLATLKIPVYYYYDYYTDTVLGSVASNDHKNELILQPRARQAVLTYAPCGSMHMGD